MKRSEKTPITGVKWSADFRQFWRQSRLLRIETLHVLKPCLWFKIFLFCHFWYNGKVLGGVVDVLVGLTRLCGFLPKIFCCVDIVVFAGCAADKWKYWSIFVEMLVYTLINIILICLFFCKNRAPYYKMRVIAVKTYN